MPGNVVEEKAGATVDGAQMLSPESTTCDPWCLLTQSLESEGMILLIVVVLVAEDMLAVLALPPEVSLGDKNTGRDSESCAEGANGRDEDDS
jgi:hypothetical protein